MSDDAFPLVPEGMFSEPVDLSDLRLQLGIVHPESRATPVVAAWDGSFVRHITPEAARGWADDIEKGADAAALEPLSTALRGLADRIDEIVAGVIANRETSRYRAISERSAQTMLRKIGLNA